MHEHVWEYGTFGRCINDRCNYVKPSAESADVEREGARSTTLPLWPAMLIFFLMSAGVVCLVSYAVNLAERVYHARFVSGIVEGVKEPRGKFSIPNSPITIKPTGKNKAALTIVDSPSPAIAGAGDEGPRRVWEGK